MHRILALSLICLPLTGLAKTVECYCTDTQGTRVELGETRCLTVGGRVFMAQCDMSLNVPIWREQDGGCVSS